MAMRFDRYRMNDIHEDIDKKKCIKDTQFIYSYLLRPVLCVYAFCVCFPCTLRLRVFYPIALYFFACKSGKSRGDRSWHRSVGFHSPKAISFHQKPWHTWASDLLRTDHCGLNFYQRINMHIHSLSVSSYSEVADMNYFGIFIWSRS